MTQTVEFRTSGLMVDSFLRSKGDDTSDFDTVVHHNARLLSYLTALLHARREAGRGGKEGGRKGRGGGVGGGGRRGGGRRGGGRRGRREEGGGWGGEEERGEGGRIGGSS